MRNIFLFCSICSFLFFQNAYAIENRSTVTPIHKYLKQLHVSNQPSGLDGIDCMYSINLDARIEKWKRVSSIFIEKGLNVNRVSGVNGYIISEDEKRELSGSYAPRLRTTQIGCLLSHLSIIHDAYKRNFDTIWVMEDDIECVDNIQQIPALLKELKTLDPQWDIFYTDTDMRYPAHSYVSSSYYFHPRPDQQLNLEEYNQPRINISKNLMRIRHRWGTHSMIISKQGIEKIRNYFQTWYLWEPIDVDLHYIPNIREYACTHDIVTNWTESTSDTTKS